MNQAFTPAVVTGVPVRPVPVLSDTRSLVSEPRFEAWAGAGLFMLLIGGFCLWASVAKLDAAVIAHGSLRPGEARTTLQSPTGGIVADVYAANGAHVRKGAPLIAFTGGDVMARERSIASRVIGLQAEIARLQASLAGRRQVGTVAAFVGLSGDDDRLAADALAREQAQLDSDRALESAEVRISAKRRAQVSAQIGGMAERIDSVRRQRELNAQELTVNQTLLDKGLVTRSRVLGLQRAAAAHDGEVGAARAEIARLRSQTDEVAMATLGAREQRLSTWSERLRLAETELQSLLPQWESARRDRSNAVLRAPFDGTISAARMPARDNVIAAGTPLFELVPDRPDFFVEARVLPTDAAELAPGQPTQVRIATLHDSNAAPVEGQIERVSADSIEDPRSGESFYTVRVRVSARALTQAGRHAGVAGGVRAGTPVELVVPTQARSAWSYLFGPLTRRLQSAFSER
jgi:HlyD family type I secretion membrane fusion protein